VLPAPGGVRLRTDPWDHQLRLSRPPGRRKRAYTVCRNIHVPSVIAHRVPTKVPDRLSWTLAKVPSGASAASCSSPEGRHWTAPEPDSCVIDIATHSSARSGCWAWHRRQLLQSSHGSSTSMVDHFIGRYPPSRRGHAGRSPTPVLISEGVCGRCAAHIARKGPAVAVEPLPPSAFPEFEDLVNGWKRYFCNRYLRLSAVSEMYNYRLRIDKRQGVLLHLRQAPPRQRNNIYILLVMSSSAEVVSRRGVRHTIAAAVSYCTTTSGGSNGRTDRSAPRSRAKQEGQHRVGRDHRAADARAPKRPNRLCAGGHEVSARSPSKRRCSRRMAETKGCWWSHSRALRQAVRGFQDLGFVNYQKTTDQRPQVVYRTACTAW
jgi:hypothetical protein